MSTKSTPECPQCRSPLPAQAPAGLCPTCLMALNLQTETALTGEAPTATQPPLPPDQIAPHFPQLEILACLGRGGMGVVYQARQKTLNRLVALKLLAPERVNDPKFAERFAREAQALARLNHPNIVTIHDHGQAGGFYYLLMEFVDGVTLRQLLQTSRVEAREALAIVPQICDALQFAHDHGIVHRDIKPENILLDRVGRVKVADFGLAKIVGHDAPIAPPDRESLPGQPPDQSALTDASRVMGTPQYMSPEQIAAPGAVDHRADIYALGVVFYQMLTGELPGRTLEPPSRKVQIDVRLDEVVLRALEKEPRLRYQKVSALKTQVETIAETPRDVPASSGVVGGQRSEGRNPKSEEDARRRRPARLNPIAWLFGGMALTLLSLMGWANYQQSRHAQAQPADSPQVLRKLPTSGVIAAGLAKPLSPWPWHELRTRSLSPSEASQIMSGLTGWLKQSQTNDQSQPLHYIDQIAEFLAKRHLATDDERIQFVQAVHGEIRGPKSLRLREGRDTLRVKLEYRYRWKDDWFNLAMMNDFPQATVDGEKALTKLVAGSWFWNNNDVDLLVSVPGLAPGRHKVKLEVLSALAPMEDLPGLSPTALSSEWPQAARRWTRTSEIDLVIHPLNAVIVDQTQNPELDPTKNRCLSVEQILVRRSSPRTLAVFEFKLDQRPPVDLGFTVSLRIAGQTIPCGEFWVHTGPTGSMVHNAQLSVALDRLPAEIREAELVLSPNPVAVEEIPTVDRIWGKPVVFSHVPLKRLDLE